MIYFAIRDYFYLRDQATALNIKPLFILDSLPESSSVRFFFLNGGALATIIFMATSIVLAYGIKLIIG